MDVARVEIETNAGRFDGLVAEASAAVGYGANTLRTVRERYREAYADALTRWQALRDELEQWDRAPASAREAGAGDAGRQALRLEVEQLGRDIGVYQSTLTKLDVAERSLSRTRLFLERGDASLEADPDDGGPLTEGDVAMRIIEAQEAERAHLAQEIPRRTRPGPVQRDLPGRLPRAPGDRRTRAGGPAAARPARPATPRARQRPRRDPSASAGDARRARA